MIAVLADKIAKSMKEYNHEITVSIEEMSFGLNILLSGVLVTVVSLAIGGLAGNMFETAQVLFFFGFLRLFSGGYHFSTALRCSIVSICFALMLPYIPIDQYECMLQWTSLILVSIFAPSRIDGQSRISNKYYPALKIISILLVSANFVIGSPTITKAFFLQSVTLISKRR